MAVEGRKNWAVIGMQARRPPPPHPHPQWGAREGDGSGQSVGAGEKKDGWGREKKASGGEEPCGGANVMPNRAHGLQGSW